MLPHVASGSAISPSPDGTLRLVDRALLSQHSESGSGGGSRRGDGQNRWNGERGTGLGVREGGAEMARKDNNFMRWGLGVMTGEL